MRGWLGQRKALREASPERHPSSKGCSRLGNCSEPVLPASSFWGAGRCDLGSLGGIRWRQLVAPPGPDTTTPMSGGGGVHRLRRILLSLPSSDTSQHRDRRRAWRSRVSKLQCVALCPAHLRAACPALCEHLPSQLSAGCSPRAQLCWAPLLP